MPAQVASVNVQVPIIMAGAAALMLSTTLLVRRGLLSIRYGLGWIAVSLVGFFSAPLLALFASRVESLGFTPTGFSLGVFILFLGLVCLQLSISLSGLHGAVQDLAEQAAVVEAQVGVLAAAAEPGPPGEEVKRVLVIVPALNEERTVGAVVSTARELGYDVCVVDDGSTDRTGARAREAGATVLSVPVNLGVGGALRCGFRWALANGYDAGVQLDADGQHDPHEVAELMTVMQEERADMVIGSRFADGAGAYQVGSLRRFAMGLLARRAERATGTRVIDSTSGFRAIRRPLLDRFAAEYPVEYLGDTVEALIEAGRAGAKIVEHPISASPRAHGTGSAGVLASVWYVARVLIAVELMHNRRRRRPGQGSL